MSRCFISIICLAAWLGGAPSEVTAATSPVNAPASTSASAKATIASEVEKALPIQLPKAASSAASRPAVQDSSRLEEAGSSRFGNGGAWALVAVLLFVAIAAWVILRVPSVNDLEVMKLRFAAMTLTGIMALFVFAAILFFLEEPGRKAGEEIFNKALTAMTPLMGVIFGYFFNSRSSPKPPTAGAGNTSG